MRDELQRYRYFSKILMIFTIMMVGFILSFFMFHSYQQNIKKAEEHELKSLQGIAKTLALNIDGDIHEKLVCSLSAKDAITKNDENKTYEKFHHLLKAAQEINDIKTPIYTLFKDENCKNETITSDAFLFGISSSTPFFRHRYASFPDCLINHFETGSTVGNYYDDHGHWLSAFHPIKNRRDEVVAVVQVDESFCSFVAEARATLMNESIFALMFLGLLTGVFIYVYQWILGSMSEINQTLEEAVTERTKKLNESNMQLKKLTGKLEKLVEARTNELKYANENLRVSNEKLKAFARVASHDLRAPLRLISSFAQLFKRRYKDLVDEQGNEYLEYITTNTQKMSALITNILSTSVTPEENANESKWVNLNNIIEDVKGNLSISIKKYKAKISFYNLPTIKGYPSEFVQLFQNLISNSIKYSRPEVAPLIKIVSHQKDDSFLITISDNGKGISPEALKNIFNEFERGDAKDDDGYGIGLATCKRIVKEYGGTLKATSTLGEGTCFFITLGNRQTAKEAYKKAVEEAVGVELRN